VTPYLDAGFVLLDLDAIREKLIEQPWVYDIAVTRNWPDEVGITVIEQTAIARWDDNGFLNHRGSLFFPENIDDALFVDLPQLSGPEQSAIQVMNHYRELSGMLNEEGLSVYQVALGERGNWMVGVSDGVDENRIEMFLGASDVMLKMHRFVSVYQLALNKNFEQVSRIDMRYNNGLAVQWSKNRAT
jgi:cell division protein FtsQ